MAANMPAKDARNWREVDPFLRLASEEMSVPYSLLVAIAHVESRFNPGVTSNAGAQGLMQTMPQTGAAMAKKLGISYRPFDAQSSARMGALYIKKMLRKFPDDVDFAIAAYNAGPGNVKKYGGIPPFAQTRAYVPAVMRAARAVTASRLRCTAVACPPDSSCAPSIVPQWRLPPYGYSGPGSSPGRRPRPSPSPSPASPSSGGAGGLFGLVVIAGLIFVASGAKS
jgi:hypothetical protein